MRKPRKLPDLTLIEANFHYNPHNGRIYKNGQVCDGWNRQGYNVITVTRTCQVTAGRLGWYLFHREDPGPNHHVIHINGDRGDNRIENLKLRKIPSAR